MKRAMQMPKWAGTMLDSKRAQAISAVRKSFDDLCDHDEWIRMTEILWQLMAEKVKSSQLEVIRHDRFGHESLNNAAAAADRMRQRTKYQHVLRALNFFFKCFDVDWNVFVRTVIDIAEGDSDGSGLDSTPERPQSEDEDNQDRPGNDDSDVG